MEIVEIVWTDNSLFFFLSVSTLQHFICVGKFRFKWLLNFSSKKKGKKKKTDEKDDFFGEGNLMEKKNNNSKVHFSIASNVFVLIIFFRFFFKKLLFFLKFLSSFFDTSNFYDWMLLVEKCYWDFLHFFLRFQK